MSLTKPKHIHELGQIFVACETYIVHNDKVLMHKRAADKKKFPGYWIGPGGHVDEGEDVFTAAQREVKEETGIDINAGNLKLKVLGFHYHIDRQEVWLEYLFPPTLYYAEHILYDKPGIMYTRIDWENLQVKTIHTKQVDQTP